MPPAIGRPNVPHAETVQPSIREPELIPMPAPAQAVRDVNLRSRLLLDDGNNQQNIDPTIHPVGGLSASNTLRNGTGSISPHHGGGLLVNRMLSVRLGGSSS